MLPRTQCTFTIVTPIACTVLWGIAPKDNKDGDLDFKKVRCSRRRPFAEATGLKRRQGPLYALAWELTDTGSVLSETEMSPAPACMRMLVERAFNEGTVGYFLALCCLFCSVCLVRMLDPAKQRSLDVAMLACP